MAQRLEQTQGTVQTQQLSSLQVAVAKVLELPITDLETRVRNEMAENEALEDKYEDGSLESINANNGSDDTDERNTNENDEEFDEYMNTDAPNSYEDTENYGAETDAMADYFSQDDVPDSLWKRADEQRSVNDFQYSAPTSFYDELRSQISEHNLTEHERELMEYLIGSLDDDGFLRKDIEAIVDELAFSQNVTTTRSKMEQLLGILQTFEPRGIGARSLQECLHIQLSDPDRKTQYTELALAVVDRYFKDFSKRHWSVIQQRLKVDNATLDHVRHELTHLNPMPGSALGEADVASAPTVVPDFFVRVNTEGEVQVSLNQGNVPELRISPSFRESIEQYGSRKSKLTREQKDAYTYARQKVDAANSFINLLERRRDTLLKVMEVIAHLQRPFFADDDESLLRPLTLKEVAERIKVDISTVSRVTNSKYVQTLYGMYPLRFFFSSQFTTSDGDELSARKVKAALRELIEHEDKHAPLADEYLAEELKKQGYNVARRTVAKYRGLMGFPTAHLRKESRRND